VRSSSQMAQCVKSALRREAQLRDILAVSIDTIIEVDVTSPGATQLLLPDELNQRARFEALIGQLAPTFLEDLLDESEKERWAAYIARAYASSGNDQALEIMNLKFGSICVESVLSLAQTNECQSILALRAVNSHAEVDVFQKESACDNMHCVSKDGTSSTDVDEFSQEVTCDSLDCISKASLIMLEDGTLEPIGSLKEGCKILAMDGNSGQLVSTQVKKIMEATSREGALLQIKCSSGIQTTCTSDHLVLSQSPGEEFGDNKACNLVVGDRVRMFQAKEETVEAVERIRLPEAEVVSLEIDHQNAFILSADPESMGALALRPNMQHSTEGASASVSVHEDVQSLSSCPTSTSHSGSTRIIKLGCGGRSMLALSEVAQIPRGPDGQLFSCGSRQHPSKCEPCWFIDRAKGCADGALCNQCHYPHKELSTSAKRRKSHYMRRKAPQPAEVTATRITRMVKNSFVEWAVVQDDDPHAETPLRRAHSAPSLQ